MEPVIVVDSNVFISALRSASGQNREVIRLCLLKRCFPLMGMNLFLEYEDVMARRALFENCPVDAKDRTTLFCAFMSVCRWTPIYFLWRPNLPDEGDNHIFELAMAGGAEVIVTNNVRHFKSGELKFPEVRILKPNEFVNEVK